VSESVRRLLQPGDGPVGIVVHDQPDDCESLLDRGRERRWVLAESAIADQRQHHSLRRCDLRPDGRGRTEAHGCESTGRQHAARRVHRELLADAILVPANVGGDDGVTRQLRTHFGEDALGHHRECI